MKGNRRSGLAIAGILCLAAIGPSWADVGFDSGRSSDVKEFLSEVRASHAPALPRMPVGPLANNAPAAGSASKPVEWVSIPGGKFMMGTDAGMADAKPIHEVDIKTFQMSKTVVTVEQYAECWIKGQCSEPGVGGLCNWGKAGRQRHPINCVDWKQASRYARFKHARLPSESEWEYAAKSGGQNQMYPWGNAAANCATAVMYDEDYGCGTGGTLPVCSKPAGNTAQGLCDMAGNVWQWVQDAFQDSYAGAPADGGAFEAAGSDRAMRGGSLINDVAFFLRADVRAHGDPRSGVGHVGFRLAR